MKRRLLGIYRLGDHNVRVFIIPEYAGGNLYFCPDDKGAAIMEVGIKYELWARCLETLLHETFEKLLIEERTALEPLGNNANSSSNRVFYLDHEQFSECCGAAAFFLEKVIPDLARAFRINQRKGRVLPKRKKRRAK